jgi:hypothetical protein
MQLRDSADRVLPRGLFAARGTDVPTYRPLLDSDFTKAAAWINAQPEWTPVEVVGDFMREPAREILSRFQWKDDYSKKIKKKLPS